MKIGTMVKIVLSNPNQDKQEGIEKIIGKEFKVTAHWKQKHNQENYNTGEIQVYSEEFGGYINLNEDEYKQV